MAHMSGSGVRVWFGPAEAEIVQLAEDGTPITASLDVGVGPMTEVTDFITTWLTSEEAQR